MPFLGSVQGFLNNAIYEKLRRGNTHSSPRESFGSVSKSFQRLLGTKEVEDDAGRFRGLVGVS